jgi:hypothetical protein
VLFSAIVLSYLAEKRKKKVYVWLLILVMSMFVGFRSEDIGADTPMYYQLFENMMNKNVYSPNVERTFLLISHFFLRFLSIEWLLFLFSLVTNSLIIFRLWSLRDKGSFAIMVTVYSIIYYPQTANIIRQCMAVALVFYGTKYLEQGKNLKYLIFVVLAFCFHRTALLGIAYYPLYYLISNRKLEKKRKALLISLILLPIGTTFYLTRISGTYTKYFLVSNNSFGFLYVGELCVVILFLFLGFRSIKVRENKETVIWCKRAIVSYVVGMLLSSAGYFQTSLYRMGLYFIVFDMAYIPFVSSKGVHKRVFKVLYTLFILFMFVNGYRSGWSGLLEYSSWLSQP